MAAASMVDFLADTIKCLSPQKVSLSCTEKDIRISGEKNTELYISIGRSAMFNKFLGSVKLRASDFTKILRECTLFCDIDFSVEDGKARLFVDDGSGCELFMDCPLEETDPINPPAFTPQTVFDLNTQMLKDIHTEEACTVEFLLENTFLRITTTGEIKTVAEQKVTEGFLKRETTQKIFIISSEAFLAVTSICRLLPTRVLMAVEKHLCAFYFYFKDATVILYSQGNLV
ncbi:hypothetical protein NEDG_01752 [Nematocida displodere]|uniref:Proliferating cell nuclear antigen n=1 Tax=Nematocida displodere TaxID=1805483 RepID=A0A177EGP8_9MICR|nr:hypothetical protein NEDG_01752 [Nematocida displodere]